MNDKPKGKTIPKQRLEIVNIEMDVSYSQGAKFLDRVHARNLSLAEEDPLVGKTIRHTVFNGELKTFIRGKKEIIADVEERPRPDTEYGPDRTIVQVYDEGKPVSTKKGGGGGSYRLSLEDELVLEGVKRRSIEGQTAVAQVGEILRSDFKPSEYPGMTDAAWQRITGKYYLAIEKGLDNYLAEPAPRQAPKPAAAPASGPRQKPQVGNPGPEKGESVSKDKPTPPEPIKHVGDLLTRAAKLDPPVTRDDLQVALSVNEPAEIKDLEAAWKTAQEMSKSKAKNGGETTGEAWDKIKRPADQGQKTAAKTVEPELPF